MKKILVTTDLSDESKVAFPLTKQLATTFGSTIILCAVVEDPSQAALSYALEFPVYPDPDVRVQLVQKISGDLKQIGTKHFAGNKIETHVVEATGAVHQEIIEFAKAQNVDLIVMSTHGRTGLSRMLIGSVAEHVVRQADRPVLTVPEARAAANR